MGEFPNKATQFSKDNQPQKNGRKKGYVPAKTILTRFLSLSKEITNPLNGVLEDLTYAEIMHLKQIANALQGDLSSYKEIVRITEVKEEEEEDNTKQTIQFNLTVTEDIGFKRQDNTTTE